MEDEIIKLKKRIKDLEIENDELWRKLQEYRKQEDIYVAKKFSSEEKMAIFRSYFYGRQDVVAQRYYSKKTGKYGYCPMCVNDFHQLLCLKSTGKKIDCIKCPNRNFISLNEELLRKHFRGDVNGRKNFCLGIYPLLKNGTCHFLAIDFDDFDWLEEMRSVYHIAKNLQLSTLLERSQSGRGGHLWLFFSESIKASKARKLGSFLLKEAMKNNQNIKLQSFDRMFPNQDYTSQEGLGNLIALPLQSESYQKGNSAFINENGECILNPIGYLSMINKITEKAIDQILQMDDDVDFFFDDDQLTIPLYADSKYDLKLNVIKSNMLYIEKHNLNALTISIIRRLASMYNPEYFLLQRLHKPIFKTTLSLNEFIENEKYIAIPRGCFDKMKKVFVGSDISIVDKCTTGSPIDLKFKGELSEQQAHAVKALMHYDYGVLQATAGFGKTVMSLKIISDKKCNTLIIVTTKKLLDQWQKQIYAFLDVPEGKNKRDTFLGQYTGNKKRLKYNLDIATVSALSNHEDINSLLKPYGMIIIDECHHIPSNSFRTILRQIHAKYIYGLSATPARQDGLEKIIYMYCGPKRFETNKKYIISQRTFLQILFPHFTNTKIFDNKLTYQAMIDEIAENENRNFTISNDIITSFRSGRKIIVLSERIRHLELLYEKIRDVSPNVYLYIGGLKQSEKTMLEKRILNLDPSENFIILATSKLLGEGFDLPVLDTLFVALPIADKNRIEQYTGRLHRECKDKTDVQVHDYVDIHIPVFEAMFQKRLKAYYREGYHLQETKAVLNLSSIIYNRETYFEALKADLISSEKQIYIHMHSYLITKVKKLHKLLMQIKQKGSCIKMIVNKDKIDDECTLYLTGAGCELYVATKQMKSNYICIDKKIVWYGDMNIFGNESQYASLIRLENKAFAQELLSDVQ